MFRPISVGMLAAVVPIGVSGVTVPSAPTVGTTVVGLDSPIQALMGRATTAMLPVFTAGPIAMRVVTQVTSADGNNGNNFCSTGQAGEPACSVTGVGEKKCSTTGGNPATCSTQATGDEFMCSAHGGGVGPRQCSTFNHNGDPKCSVLANGAKCSITHTADVGGNQCSVFGIDDEQMCSVFKDAGDPDAECTTFGQIDPDSNLCSAESLPQGALGKCSAMNEDGSEHDGPDANGRCRAQSPPPF